MSWIHFHSESEKLASEAEVELRKGNISLANSLYCRAAEEEFRAINELDQSKARTISITAVSAVSLLYKAAEYTRAEQAAYKYLTLDNIQEFAVAQLRSLLQSIWNETAMKKANIKFVPGQVLVAVRGGEIQKGGAPLDLVLEKVQTVQSYFYRTAEFLKKLPHRKKGPPDKDLQSICRPWLFQAVPSSYQFAVAIQEPAQLSLFEGDKPSSEKIASSFLNILRASLEDPDGGLIEIVPDKDYQTTFIKLTRNLVPTGRSYNQMEIRASDGRNSISLIPAFRESLNENLKRRRIKLPGEEKPEEILHGTLRAIHLDQDWLELHSEDNSTIRVKKIGDALDDIIGPMVNRPVTVKAVKKHDRFEFIDIEPVD